ncbi:MAG: MBL fold metallo-hydrolase [Dysgonomonas sp.]|nr:MBL fold metallo-hydrolase [Dysgonomonas sp.]
MFKIHIINTGYIMADGGAMFGAIPKRAWARKFPADRDNKCPLAMRCVLAISEDRKVLIDTGIGEKHLDKISYYQPYDLIDIEQSLNSYNLRNEDITDVILTHLHFDHCGYATRKDKQGKVISSFPNARYWVSRKQWANFQNPNRLEKDSFFIDNIIPIHKEGLLHLVEEDIDIDGNLRLKLFDGHTPGQLVGYLDTTEGMIAFPGDLIPTSAHIALEWISAYDICALTSIMEKERFLNEAVKNDYQIIYCHDPYITKSRIKKLNDNYKAFDLSNC